MQKKTSKSWSFWGGRNGGEKILNIDNFIIAVVFLNFISDNRENFIHNHFEDPPGDSFSYDFSGKDILRENTSAMRNSKN